MRLRAASDSPFEAPVDIGYFYRRWVCDSLRSGWNQLPRDFARQSSPLANHLPVGEFNSDCVDAAVVRQGLCDRLVSGRVMEFTHNHPDLLGLITPDGGDALRSFFFLGASRTKVPRGRYLVPPLSSHDTGRT
jgi:hypothetical protein